MQECEGFHCLSIIVFILLVKCSEIIFWATQVISKAIDCRVQSPEEPLNLKSTLFSLYAIFQGRQCLENGSRWSSDDMTKSYENVTSGLARLGPVKPPGWTHGFRQ